MQIMYKIKVKLVSAESSICHILLFLDPPLVISDVVLILL